MHPIIQQSWRLFTYVIVDLLWLTLIYKLSTKWATRTIVRLYAASIPNPHLYAICSESMLPSLILLCFHSLICINWRSDLFAVRFAELGERNRNYIHFTLITTIVA